MARDRTSKQLAAEFAVHPATVDRWVQKGCPHANQGNGKPRSFDPAEVELWLKNRTSRAYRKGSEDEMLHRKKLKEQVRKLRTANDAKEADLIKRNEVIKGYSDRIAFAKSILLRIGKQISSKLMNQDQDFIENELDRAIREALTELSGGITGLP
jgi:phage terminase Nu1 subunit (DNA packaging protein)